MNTQFELEGQLLETTMKIDKLMKKENLTNDEKETLEDLEKRKNILNKRLREMRMKGL